MVWLTAITLDSLFGSTLFSSTFAGLVAAFGSIFLFVTGTFNFSGTTLGAVRDKVFAFGATVLLAVLIAAFTAVLVGVLSGAFVVLAGFATTPFFTTGFAIDLPDAPLVAAAVCFFAVEVGFAGFFIAFAMESVPNGCSRAPNEVRLVEPKMRPDSAIARAT